MNLYSVELRRSQLFKYSNWFRFIRTNFFFTIAFNCLLYLIKLDFCSTQTTISCFEIVKWKIKDWLSIRWQKMAPAKPFLMIFHLWRYPIGRNYWRIIPSKYKLYEIKSQVNAWQVAKELCVYWMNSSAFIHQVREHSGEKNDLKKLEKGAYIHKQKTVQIVRNGPYRINI